MYRLRYENVPDRKCRVSILVESGSRCTRLAEVLTIAVSMRLIKSSGAQAPTTTSAYLSRLVTSASCDRRMMVVSNPQVHLATLASMPCRTCAFVKRCLICSSSAKYSSITTPRIFTPPNKPWRGVAGVSLDQIPVGFCSILRSSDTVL